MISPRNQEYEMKNKFLNAFYYLTTGLMLGILADFVISNNIWLEMRIHGDTPLWVLSAIGLVYGVLKKKSPCRYTFFVTELLAVGVYAVVGKFNLLLYLIRDAVPFLETIDETRVFVIAFLAIVTLLNVGVIYLTRKD